MLFARPTVNDIIVGFPVSSAWLIISLHTRWLIKTPPKVLLRAYVRYVLLIFIICLRSCRSRGKLSAVRIVNKTAPWCSFYWPTLWITFYRCANVRTLCCAPNVTDTVVGILLMFFIHSFIRHSGSRDHKTAYEKTTNRVGEKVKINMLQYVHRVRKKGGHVIFNYNSRISWSIFIIFALFNTGMNTIQLCVIYLLKCLMTS